MKHALLCAVGLERLALAEVRAGFEHSSDPRARMTAERDALREVIELQAEELRILGARIGSIPPQKRPHYPPQERLAVLFLRAKAGWTAAETARRFLVTPATIASWMHRLDEEGEQALVQSPVPVNRFDDAIRLVVQKLHHAAPGFGRRKLAEVLARAGLLLAASTARRIVQRNSSPLPLEPEPEPEPVTTGATTAKRAVTARRPHHVWHADITTLSIGPPRFGFWTPWWPFALVLRWALSWHLAVVVDHFSRALIAFAVFRKEPTAAEICELLDRAVARTGAPPRYLITDRGSQFQDQYLAWCRKNGVRPRFGAVGKKGSIAIVERFILSLKRELLWKIFVPASLPRMERVLAAYEHWYNEERPHEGLAGCAPADLLRGAPPVAERVHLEPRASWSLARGDPSVKRCGRLELTVSYVDGLKQLPVVRPRQAA